jgi:hypothetical protein
MTIRELLAATDAARALRDALSTHHNRTDELRAYWDARRAYVDTFNAAWEATGDLRTAVADFAEDMTATTFDRLVVALFAALEDEL